MANCLKSRKPVRVGPATLGLPIVMLIVMISSAAWFANRVVIKQHGDGRAVDCTVKALQAEKVVVGGVDKWAPKVVVYFGAEETVEYDAYMHGRPEEGKHYDTEAAAASALQPLFVVGQPPPTQISAACYAKHNEIGEVINIKLQRTRTPVATDISIAVISVIVAILAATYIAWLLVNHHIKKSLSREVGVVRILAVGMNYTECLTDGVSPLTGITDSDNFVSACDNAGIQDITYLTDTNYIANAALGMAPTKEVVLASMKEIGSRCNDDDMFIFFYAGHGENVEDHDGDEDDGKDEAFVLMDSFGNCDESTFLVDDQFVEALVDYFPPGCRIMIFTDCCHSGTIADLEKDIIKDRAIVHIAGAQDHQEAADSGHGGAATTAMLETVFSENGLDVLEGGGQYTVMDVYRRMKKWMVTEGYTADGKVDPDLQNIVLNWTPSCEPSDIPWPISKKGFIIDQSRTNLSEPLDP